MAKSTFQLDDWLIAQDDSLANNGDLDVEPADWDRPNVRITTLIVGGGCDVKFLTASDGDFSSPDVNVTIESYSGSGIVTDIGIPIQQSRSTLRITNTSGSSASFAVVGRVLPKGSDI